jgi:hypothetical protein
MLLQTIAFCLKTVNKWILGKAWFEEFTSRDQNTLEVNGNKFVFELGEEKVEI